MGLKIETVVRIQDFLQCKGARMGVEFDVVLAAKPPKGNEVELESSVIIAENVAKDSILLNFMEDFVRPYVGGYVLMNFAYFKYVDFENGCLTFKTSNGYEISLK